jgi:alkaline phosphatase D
VLTANRDEVRVDWHYVSDKLNPNAAVALAHSYRTRHDTATVEPML